VGATLWFAGAAVLQARYSPYAKPWPNALEMATLLSTFLTASISSALLQFNVGVTTAELHEPDAMMPIEWAVTILLAALNLGTFLLLAGLWLHLQCARAHQFVRRVSNATAPRVRILLSRPGRPATTTAPMSASTPPTTPASGSSGGSTTVTSGSDDSTAPPTIINPLRAHTTAAPPIPAAARGATSYLDDTSMPDMPSVSVSWRRVSGSNPLRVPLSRDGAPAASGGGGGGGGGGGTATAGGAPPGGGGPADAVDADDSTVAFSVTRVTRSRRH